MAADGAAAPHAEAEAEEDEDLCPVFGVLAAESRVRSGVRKLQEPHEITSWPLGSRSNQREEQSAPRFTGRESLRFPPFT